MFQIYKIPQSSSFAFLWHQICSKKNSSKNTHLRKKNLNSTATVHIMHCAMVYARLYRLVKQFTSSWGPMIFCFKGSTCILKTLYQCYYKIVRYNWIATIFCGSGTVTWSDLDSRYHNIQFFFTKKHSQFIISVQNKMLLFFYFSDINLCQKSPCSLKCTHFPKAKAPEQ